MYRNTCSKSPATAGNSFSINLITLSGLSGSESDSELLSSSESYLLFLLSLRLCFSFSLLLCFFFFLLFSPSLRDFLLLRFSSRFLSRRRLRNFDEDSSSSSEDDAADDEEVAALDVDGSGDEFRCRDFLERLPMETIQSDSVAQNFD